jgi:hypothetical protein
VGTRSGKKAARPRKSPAIFAEVFPRIALAVLWIATDLVDRAFSTWVIPLLGLIVLPFTTLAYAIAWAPGVHLGRGRWVWVAIAFAIELMGYAGTARTNRERMPRAESSARGSEHRLIPSR